MIRQPGHHADPARLTPRISLLVVVRDKAHSFGGLDFDFICSFRMSRNSLNINRASLANRSPDLWATVVVQAPETHMWIARTLLIRPFFHLEGVRLHMLVRLR